MVVKKLGNRNVGFFKLFEILVHRLAVLDILNEHMNVLRGEEFLDIFSD
jgi:hypothetical protein